MAVYLMKRTISCLCGILAALLVCSCLTTGAPLGARGKPSPQEQALITAVLQGNLTAAEGLLRQGVSPNAKAVSGDTILQLAVNGGNLEITRLLIRYKGDPNAQNALGYTALYFAVKPAMHRFLLESGADPFYTPKNGYSPFEFYCAQKAYVTSEADKQKMMGILQSQGIKLTRDHFERTSWLNRADLVETVKIYQSFNYDINKTTNSTQELALHLAAVGDNYTMMLILIEAGARGNFLNAFHQEPLNIIASQKDSKNSNADFGIVLKALLRAGANINEKDSTESTPLFNAVIAGNPERVRLLLASPGLRIDESCEYGETAVFRAGNLQIAKYLVAAGANIEAQSNAKNTPLFIITNTEVVGYLIKSGANIHHLNMGGLNILVHNMRAARKIYLADFDEEAINRKFLGKFELLIKAGIDVNYTPRSEQTALYIAKSVPFTAFVRLLEKAGAKK